MTDTEKLFKGAYKLADYVKITMGPGGDNVILARSGAPRITKDGVSVAKEVEFEDPIENLGAQLVKQAAISTNDKVGDGTTTATVLTEAILQYSETVDDKKALVKRLREDLPDVVEKIRKSSRDVESVDDIYHVAKVSLDGDDHLASLIAEVYEQVDDNIVYAEKRENDPNVDIWQGMRFQSSYISTYFINDHLTGTTSYEDGYVIVLDGKVQNPKQIMPYMDKAALDSKPLLIVAEDLDNNSIISITNNLKQGKLSCVVVNSPGFGAARQKYLEDIAVYSGTEVVEPGMRPKKIGTFKSLYIDDNHTVIQTKEVTDEVKKYVKGLEGLKKRLSGGELEFVQNRIDKFKKGIGCVYIDAATDLEYKEVRDRMEDAVNAVKQAVEGGVVDGGGSCLGKLSYTVSPDYYTILQAPGKQIKANLGVSTLITESDIIDPTNVVITALESAVSVATTIISTKAAVL